MSKIIRLAEQCDFDACVQMCTDSFMDYDFSKVYCTENEEKRRCFTESIFDIAIGLGIKNKQVLVMEEDGKILCAIGLQSPTDKDYSLSDYLKNGILKAFHVAGLKNTLGYLKLLSCSEKTCKKIKEPHWYTLFFAVHKDYQREGLGTYMIKNGVLPHIQNIQKYKDDGNLLVLVTNSATNEVFYKKNGFETIKEEILYLNKKKLGNWTMSIRI